MTSRMRAGKAASEFQQQIDILVAQIQNLRAERSRYVTGIYKIFRTASAGSDPLTIIISGIDREIRELTEALAALKGDVAGTQSQTHEKGLG